MVDLPDWLALTLLGLMVLIFIAAAVLQLVAFFRLGDDLLGWWRRRRDR
jgi:hypothetical protein